MSTEELKQSDHEHLACSENYYAKQIISAYLTRTSKKHNGVICSPLWYGQGIGNGIPLGAVVTTPEIATVLTRRNYFNTFGGNPVCTTAGHAVLKVIEKQKLQDNAHVVGSYMKEKLTSLEEKYDSKHLTLSPYFDLSFSFSLCN